MLYRRDIDGMRALSVLAVLFFHAELPYFEGGFVGVDVFFVISGYLITSILLNNLKNEEFSLKNFYEKRARRILPALFVVLLCMLPFAFFILLPSELLSFSKGLLGVSLFFSNVLFWREGGYFGAATELNPILHTWSLSVEEQFYIFFPLFLLFFWKKYRSHLLLALATIFSVSFALSEYGARIAPTANFYLFHGRAWEMLSGSLLAYFYFNKTLVKKSNGVLSFLGLCLIASSVVFFDQSTPFPGVYAVLPVGGALLLLAFSDSEKNLVGKMLSTKLFVLLGVCSYSIYLWHQPLFAFFRVSQVDLTYLIKGVLIFFSLLLGYLSWRFVENPFRNRSKFSSSFIFKSAFLGILFFIFVGIVGLWKNGFSERYASHQREFLSIDRIERSRFVMDQFNESLLRDFDSKKKKILIIGDSYAQDFYNILTFSPQRKGLTVSTHYIASGCGNLDLESKTFKEFVSKKEWVSCQKYQWYKKPKLLNLLQEADVVYLASFWNHWQINLLDRSIKNIQRKTNAKIFVVNRKSFPVMDKRKLINLEPKELKSYVTKLSPLNQSINLSLEEALSSEQVIDLQGIVCSREHTCPIFDQSGSLITYDSSHLTEKGAQYFSRKIFAHLGLDFISLSDGDTF